jgi:nucleotide-binding universal stress UspA family protein
MKLLLAAADLEDGRLASEFVETWLPRQKRVLYVIHVVEPPGVLSDLSRPIFSDWRKHVLTKARGLVGRLAKPLASQNSKIRPLVLEGTTKRTLLHLISDYGIDMTIVAPQASFRAKRFLLGSISESILHNSPTSVAIARARPRRHKRRTIVIGLDGSSCAHKAAKWVLQSRISLGSRILLVSVDAPPPDAFLDRLARINTEIPPLLQRAQEARNRRTRRSLERTGNLLRAQRYTVETVISEGVPAAQILGLAKRYKADLIILGSRGLGSFDRYILGSVSSKVARYADCSVVIVK